MIQPSVALFIRPMVISRASAAALLLALSACEKPAAPAPQAKPAAAGPSVERGKYLVTIAGCNDCHTPFKMGEHGPEPDMTRMLSGHPQLLTLPPPPAIGDGPWVAVGSATFTAWSGPWGISYTANLTPDDKTGIGKWTEEMFVGAMRTGKQMGNGRPILPPMPWPWYAQMTDDDLKSIFLYLKSIPPIENAVPAAVIAPMPEAPGK